MYFEPDVFPDVLSVKGPIEALNYVSPVGFSKPPGGEIGSKNHALNAHTYCCQIAGMCADSGGEPKPDDKSAKECLAFHEQRIGKRSADAARLGVPLLMSEFGACLDSEACAREIMQVADISD